MTTSEHRSTPSRHVLRARVHLKRGRDRYLRTYDLDERGSFHVDRPSEQTFEIVSAHLFDEQGHWIEARCDSHWLAGNATVVIAHATVEMAGRAWRPTIAQLRELGLDTRNPDAYAAALDAIVTEVRRP